jgi:3,4-dihydroxy 2-butanone 4-phosphate synthase/GTP cyclohydrolase II
MNPTVPDSDAIEVASATLPTRSGEFRIHVFESVGEPSYLLSREQVALVKGDPGGTDPVLVRIQSECMTGEVFGSLRCDCRAQLRRAQKLIQNEARGVLLYLRQEGRGIGLANKIRAYALQDEGADTVDANLRLHLPADARDYQLAAKILGRLGVSRVRLLTNNLDKQRGLERWGVEVVERVPLEVGFNAHSAAYLEAKRTRMNHQGRFDEPEEPSGHH